MASIQPCNGKWRAQVYVHGKRASKILPTKRQAEEWAERAERNRGKLPVLRDIRDHHLLELLPRKMREALTKITCSEADVMDLAFPVDVLSGIYFLIREGEITYIGQAENFLYRIYKHKKEGRKFDYFSFIPCEIEKLDELEQVYITAFMPDENKRLF